MKKLLLTCTDLMAIQFFTEHMKCWVENGYEVHLACSPVGGRVPELQERFKSEPNVTISEIHLQRSPFSLSNYKGYKELKELFKHQSYDCIVTNEPVMGLLTRLAARKEKSRVIYIAHGFHFYKGGSKLKNFLFRNIERFGARHTDCLVTLNHEDFEAGKAFKLRSKEPVEYLPGIGVNTTRFTNAISNRSAMREKLGLRDQDVAIAVIGELNDNKNQQVLINAMPSILEKCPSAKLLLIGEGQNREAYETLIKSLDLNKCVTLLGYRKDVPDILSACDIGVSASGREGLPLNLIEEMAVGLPLVSSVNRGHVEIINEGNGGFFCKENLPEVYANTLLRLCNDRQLRKRFGEFNLHECKKFDITIVKDKLLEIIREK